MYHRIILNLVAFLLVLLPAPSYALNLATNSENAPVFLQADAIAADQEYNILVAQGKVEIEQAGQVLLADEVTYFENEDRVVARGNVSLLDIDGNVFFADEVELRDQMKNAFVREIRVLMLDGGKIAGRQAVRENAERTTVSKGVYTPCDLCESDPDKPPLWQVKAHRVIYDEVNQDIIYNNARLEMFGVPVAYTPYLAHPAPSVKRRSGFLKPSVGNDSKLGFIADTSYYHTMGPHHDTTLRLITTGKQGVVVNNEYRRRFENGQIYVDASLNRSEIIGGSNNDIVIKEEDWRGHLFSNGRWELNENWRTGYSFSRATDREYLEDFNFSSADILTNSLYAERLKGRDYSEIKTVYFYDLRPDNQSLNQPELLPWITHSMVGEPNKTLGGRWAMDAEYIGLVRDTEQSMYRLAVAPSWKREFITPFGLNTQLGINSQLVSYYVNDKNAAPGDSENTAENRAFGSIYVKNRMPFVKPTSFGHALVEPMVSMTIAPNTLDNNDVPNEDSRDVQLDYSNLFAASRYPGIDRMETGTHAAYGLKVGLYDDEGSHATAAIGQSKNLAGDPNFPDGSGLEENASDYVGSMEISYKDIVDFDYRFQLDQDNLTDRRHELQGRIGHEGYSLSGTYLFAEEVQGTGIRNDRQQLTLNTTVPLSDYWRFNVATLHNMSGGDNGGLLKAQAGLTYEDECFTFSALAYRNLTERSKGGSEHTLLLTIAFEKLGKFISPAIDKDFISSLTGSSDDDDYTTPPAGSETTTTTEE